jgi:hypothetical protein
MSAAESPHVQGRQARRRPRSATSPGLCSCSSRSASTKRWRKRKAHCFSLRATPWLEYNDQQLIESARFNPDAPLSDSLLRRKEREREQAERAKGGAAGGSAKESAEDAEDAEDIIDIEGDSKDVKKGDSSSPKESSGWSLWFPPDPGWNKHPTPVIPRWDSRS